jgi:sugar/nucleoside kinase (ribokinase family)
VSRPAIDVLGLGCVAVDELLYVETYPPAEAKVRVRRRERQCGGLTATALVTASRLGARAAFAGVLGNDDDSLFVRSALERESVDLSHLVVRPEARPIHSTIVVDETHQTRTVFFDLQGSTGADPHAPPDDVIRAARVLFVDHYGIEGMTRAARIARQAGVAVVADLERNEWSGFDDLLALVDHLIVSRNFAARLTGEADPARAVDRLWSPSRKLVAVTAGEEGCWYRGDGGETGHQPAFAVETVDSTGCGDVFHGAYAASLARGEPLAERLRFAAGAAAMKAMHRGPQAGIPRRADLAAWLTTR